MSELAAFLPTNALPPYFEVYRGLGTQLNSGSLALIKESGEPWHQEEQTRVGGEVALGHSKVSWGTTVGLTPLHSSRLCYLCSVISIPEPEKWGV